VIEVRPGYIATAEFEGAPADALNDTTFRFYDPADDSDFVATTNDGIVDKFAGANPPVDPTTFRRAFTAPDTEGFYRVEWDHPDLSEPVTEDVNVDGAAPIDDLPDWAPTVDDIALLLRTRTISSVATGLGADTGSAEATTFNSTTRPTAAEVERVIYSAARFVLGQLPDEIPDRFNGRLSHVVALYSAVLVEISFFREQQDGTSTYLDLFNAALASLIDGISASEATGLPGPTSVEMVVNADEYLQI
jgi:hypothetical protein